MSGEGLRLERSGRDKPPIEGKANDTFGRMAVGSKEKAGIGFAETGLTRLSAPRGRVEGQVVWVQELLGGNSVIDFWILFMQTLKQTLQMGRRGNEENELDIDDRMELCPDTKGKVGGGWRGGQDVCVPAWQSVLCLPTQARVTQG